jgi:hypothetical protein
MGGQHMVSKLQKTKTKAFKIMRIPAQNGEWVDVHACSDDTVWVSTTGYANVNPHELTKAIRALTNQKAIRF